jgi:diaminohydroxyphosphoribosylaminopyrimidine deaminase / 5-amino-6-(5-phosphoribosylamino)uracil reductase
MNAADDDAGQVRPAITLKLATSLDGRIATASGESRWITGEAARAEVHRLRAAHDAVLAGSGTVLADDPELTARTDPPQRTQPLRIVADGRARMPRSARIFATLAQGPVAIATLETTDIEATGWPRGPGLEVWLLAADAATGRIDPMRLALAAHGAGVRSMMIEGGGQLAASFLRAGLVDRIEWFRAPIVLGEEGRPGVGPLGLEKLSAAPGFQRVALREIGADAWERYERL